MICIIMSIMIIIISIIIMIIIIIRFIIIIMFIIIIIIIICIIVIVIIVAIVTFIVIMYILITTIDIPIAGKERSGSGAANHHPPKRKDRHRLNGCLAQWVPSCVLARQLQDLFES